MCALGPKIRNFIDLDMVTLPELLCHLLYHNLNIHLEQCHMHLSRFPSHHYTLLLAFLSAKLYCHIEEFKLTKFISPICTSERLTVKYVKRFFSKKWMLSENCNMPSLQDLALTTLLRPWVFTLWDKLLIHAKNAGYPSLFTEVKEDVRGCP